MTTPPTSNSDASDASLPEWTVQQVHDHLQGDDPPLLLDVREDYELHLSRLPTARHIPLGDLHARWREIPRDRPVVVFCHHGVRSYNVVAQLTQAGFTNMINMIGGIDAWARLIDPTLPRY